MEMYLSACAICSNPNISKVDEWSSGLTIYGCALCGIFFLNPRKVGTGFEYPNGFIKS